jgi:hypothetical protein
MRDSLKDLKCPDLLSPRCVFLPSHSLTIHERLSLSKLTKGMLHGVPFH